MKFTNNRAIFSVSKEFRHIVPVLEKHPNASRFICEAVSEKLRLSGNSQIESQVVSILSTLLTKPPIDTVSERVAVSDQTTMDDSPFLIKEPLEETASDLKETKVDSSEDTSDKKTLNVLQEDKPSIPTSATSQARVSPLQKPQVGHTIRRKLKIENPGNSVPAQVINGNSSTQEENNSIEESHAKARAKFQSW